MVAWEAHEYTRTNPMTDLLFDPEIVFQFLYSCLVFFRIYLNKIYILIFSMVAIHLGQTKFELYFIFFVLHQFE